MFETGTLYPNSKLQHMKKLNGLTTCVLLLFGTGAYSQYCAPYAGVNGCNYGDYISNVSIGTINNPSVCSGGSYGDYTAQSTTVVAGTTETIAVSLNPDFNQGIGVFVDWNQDFDFTDPGEFFSNGNVTDYGFTENITITVPLTATGGPTRMRVMCRYSSVATSGNSCTTSSNYGEFEDYTLNVLPAGTHLNFDGVDDYVSLTPDAFNDLPSGTIETWVYFNALGMTQTVCAKQSDSENSYVLMRIEPSGNVYYQPRNGISITSIGTLTAGSWHHLAIAFDSNSANLYINGLLDNTVAGDFFIPNDLTVTATALGAWPSGGGGNYFNGSLEEFRVWNTKASAETINRRMNCEALGSEPGLVRYYQFNQGIGNYNNAGVTTLIDSVALPQNGTLMNFALSGLNSNWASGSPVIRGVPIPLMPTLSSTTVTYCLNETASPLTANGTGLRWFGSQSGGIGSSTAPLPVTSAPDTTSYWVASTNSNGCESERLEIQVVIFSPSSGTDVQTACEPFEWIDGNTYTSSNNTATYTIVNGAATGCDSIVTLNLTIFTPTTGTDVQTACGSFDWIDGNTYTSSNNTATYTLTSAVGCDSVVTLDLTILAPTSGTDVQTACGTYTWMDGNTYTSSNSTATYILTNAAGCDSVITLDLTINPNPNAVATDNNDGTISANAASSYQWTDCNAGTSINGATSQTYTPAVVGQYSVIITDANGCSDESDCLNFTYLSLDELSTTQLEVYPNPTANSFTVITNLENATYQLTDAKGAVIKSGMVFSGSVIDLSTCQSGIYFLNVMHESGKLVKRVLKN